MEIRLCLSGERSRAAAEFICAAPFLFVALIYDVCGGMDNGIAFVCKSKFMSVLAKYLISKNFE